MDIKKVRDNMQEEKENEVNLESNQDLKKLMEEIDSKKAEIEEKDDRLKRLMAEFDNFKKRSQKERDVLYNSLVSEIFQSLLPVIDNLEKAVSAKTEDAGYKQGVEMVLKQFQDVLNANGIKEIESVGKTFNPELHEAIGTVTDESLGEKEIKEEYRKGYIIGDKVIRHSLVVVAN
jgi:molecular chaperone GrpE